MCQIIQVEKYYSSGFASNYMAIIKLNAHTEQRKS